ncbi:type IV toxin-antitoxin system AbiEi family antitoxin domain-containing protein [Gordonia sp. VNQ95]|uniref:type IV toxin-antitoxin system AbiEi family antitoxin domain-containing protein n=1 Tax=Gordonia TaxID=2053 RepID=UPI0032B5EAAE
MEPHGVLLRPMAMDNTNNIDKIVTLGVSTRPELLAAGVTDTDIKRMVRRKELEQIRRGWFATPGADLEAIAAARRYGAVSGPTALTKYGIWVPPGYDQLHVRTGKAATRQWAGCCRPPGSPTPVTTILDPLMVALAAAAHCMTDEHWIVVCDSVMNMHGLDVEWLIAMLPGVDEYMRMLLEECDPASMSGTETIVRVRLRRLGYVVIVQPPISRVGLVDLRVENLLIECDSELHHTSLESYRKDRRRDRKALTKGLDPLRLTYDDVLYGWKETVEDIEQILQNERHHRRLTDD